MAQPTVYKPLYDYGLELGSSHGQHLDNDFAAINHSLGEFGVAMADLRRDDGKVGNSIIHPESLDAATLAMIGGGNFSATGYWQTGINYAKNDLAENNLVTYVATVSHLSGDFATDRAAGKWILMGATALEWPTKAFFGKAIANSFQTYGITINIDNAPDEALALQANDVNHQMTDDAETITFGAFGRRTPTGGFVVTGYSGGEGAIFIEGQAQNANSNKDNTAVGAVELIGSKRSGSGHGPLGAGGNVLVLRDDTNVVALVDSNGLLWLRGGQSTDVVGNSQIYLNFATANPNMQYGMTVRHPAGLLQQMLCGKHSDVSTGLSTAPDDDVQTDDWFILSRATLSSGGAHMYALAEDNALVPTVLQIHAHGGTASTGDTTATEGLINIRATEHNGADGLVNAPTNQNIFTIQGWAGGAKATRLLLKGDDGELHLGNTTLVALDEEDDIGLVAQFEAFRTLGQSIADFEVMRSTTDYDKLAEIGLVGSITRGEWERGERPLMSMQRSVQLLNGEARQRHAKFEAVLEVLESVQPAFRAAYNNRLAAKGMQRFQRPQ